MPRSSSTGGAPAHWERRFLGRRQQPPCACSYLLTAIFATGGRKVNLPAYSREAVRRENLVRVTRHARRRGGGHPAPAATRSHPAPLGCARRGVAAPAPGGGAAAPCCSRPSTPGVRNNGTRTYAAAQSCLTVGTASAVGPKTEPRLRELTIITIGDLAAVPPEQLVAAFGRAHGTYLTQSSRGIDNSPLQAERVSKSISAERTFATDTAHRQVPGQELKEQAEEVAARLRGKGCWQGRWRSSCATPIGRPSPARGAWTRPATRRRRSRPAQRR